MLLASPQGHAQAEGMPEPPVVVEPPVSHADQSAAEPVEGRVIPALTPVVIEVVPALGSRISKTGDLFAIRLVEPVMLDGTTVMPAGAGGMGEVVHAKKPGGSGAPGELVLAARFLEVDGRQLRLRSMNYADAGESKYKTVNNLLIASSATFPAASLIGFAITGKDTNVAAGTVVSAKTAIAFAVAPLLPAPAAETPPAVPAASDPEPAPNPAESAPTP